MDNLSQAKNLKKALDLEISIADINQELSCQKPSPPVRSIIERVYPPIVPSVKFNWLRAFMPLGIVLFLMFLVTLFPRDALMFLGFLATAFLLALVWIPVYYFVFHRKEKKAEIEKIRNSAEYRNYCIQEDKKFDKMQKDSDTVYERQKQKYDYEILPQFYEKIQEYEEHLKVAEEHLDKHYKTTKIVPKQYRTIRALQYIYDIVSTSDFDILYAIDDYNKSERQRLEEAQLHELQLANQLASEQIELLEELNATTAKARVEANMAAATGIAQRAKTNKFFKEIANRRKRK